MQLTSLVYGALALVIASSISPVHSIAPCSRDAARPRKEFRNLSTTERNRYFEALRALKAEMRSTSSGSVSTYDLLVNIHITNSNWVHGYANFFSWHRRYLREVERHLQRVMNNDLTIMIPYWQWTLDSQNPAASPIFSSNAFGGNGGCFSSGQLSNWRPRFPSSHCLSRSFDAGSRISTWDNAAVINGIILTSTTYDDIREQIEGGGHASVHVQIGGDMSQMRSPNDPIFWSHHAFIDKIWDDWQKLNGWSNYWKYNGPNQDGTQASLSDQMRPWSHTVRQILWTENLGYCYQAYSSSNVNLARRQTRDVPSFITITPVDEILSNPANEEDFDLLHRLVPNNKKSNKGKNQDDDDDDEETMGGASDSNTTEVDETNLFKLRYAKAIPEDYLKRNNLNVGRIRQYEAKKRHWCDKLNAQDDYVSPSAIINQPHLLRALAKNPKVKKLYGVIRGDYIEVDVSKVNNDDTLADQVYKQVTGTVKNKYGGYMKTSIDLYKLFTSTQ